MKKKAFEELKARQHTRLCQREHKRMMKHGVLRINLESNGWWDLVKLNTGRLLNQGIELNAFHTVQQHGIDVMGFAEKLQATHVHIEPEEATAKFLRQPYKHHMVKTGDRMTRAEYKRAAAYVQERLRRERVVATLTQIVGVLKSYMPYKPVPLTKGLYSGVLIPLGYSASKFEWLRSLSLMAVDFIKIKAGAPVFLGLSGMTKSRYYSHSKGHTFILPAKF